MVEFSNRENGSSIKGDVSPDAVSGNRKNKIKILVDVFEDEMQSHPTFTAKDALDQLCKWAAPFARFKIVIVNKKPLNINEQDKDIDGKRYTYPMQHHTATYIPPDKS